MKYFIFPYFQTLEADNKEQAETILLSRMRACPDVVFSVIKGDKLPYIPERETIIKSARIEEQTK